MGNSFFDRDISWLSFNHRVLHEANDESVPLLERLKFVSIYSSNLDEFYRVRIPMLLSLQRISKKNLSAHFEDKLPQIESVVKGQMKDLGSILTDRIFPQLKKQNIHVIYETSIPDYLVNVCTTFFFNHVAGYIQPVFIEDETKEITIENNKLQILVRLSKKNTEEKLAIVNIPTDYVSRFFYWDDSVSDIRHIIFLDDIIKLNLPYIFSDYSVTDSYSFKITRSAALDLHDEFEGDIAEKIRKELKKRDWGLATRFLYQPGIPLRVLYTLISKLSLTNANMVPGGIYHNLKDIATIPLPENPSLRNEVWNPLTQNLTPSTESIFTVVAQKDIIVHTPYQSYLPVIRFFNEAALDTQVIEIYFTIYRVAKDSMILNSLISAAKNGKKVTVFVELKARFDEANNLDWASKMKEAGIRIIYSIPGLKVHAKIALVKRNEDNRVKYYGLFSTGNFNENTATVYTDHILLTAHPDLVRELELLFIFFPFRVPPQKNTPAKFDHLLVSQFNLQSSFLQLIDQEIIAAKEGIAARITIKLNSLEDQVLINKLYEASNAGVQIQLIVRSICCLIPGVINMSENISISRIVDRYLEHGRIFIFQNRGNPKVFMGSADWMNRSMYYRIEVCFPIYDESIKQQLIQLIDIQLSDTEKAVQLNSELENITKKNENTKIRSQQIIYQLLKG